MSRDPLTLVLALGMLAGPLLQGLTGQSDPLAYIFAILISVALLRPPVQSSGREVGVFVIGFLIIGALSLGLWWLGGQMGPLTGWPNWLPVGVTVVFVLAAMARRRLMPPGPGA
jgi:apolipoprotein N-acyltransferase